MRDASTPPDLAGHTSAASLAKVVGKLREFGDLLDYPDNANLVHQAADTIEALARERDTERTARRDAEARAGDATARLYRPGVLRCAKCGFRLVSSILHANTGSISPNDKTENCPNDGAPMWRISWEEDCREADRLWSEQYERAAAAEAALAQAREALEKIAALDRHSGASLRDRAASEIARAALRAPEQKEEADG